MNIKFTYIKDFVFILLILGLGWNHFFHSPNTPQKHGTEGQRIAAGLFQGQTDVVTSIDTSKLSKGVLGAVRNNSISSDSRIISEIDGAWSNRKNEHSTNVDKYKIKKKQLYWVDGATGQEMPIGVALYSPKKDSMGIDPWIAKAYNLSFRTQIIRSVDKSGGVHNTVSLFAKPKNVKGYTKEFPLNMNLDKTRFIEVKNSKYSWSLWNPTLSLGLNWKQKSSGFMTKFNFINYGYSDSLPVWQVLSPTLLVNNNKADVGVEFLSYNVGEILPVVKDIHVGIGIDTKREISINLSSVF